LSRTEPVVTVAVGAPAAAARAAAGMGLVIRLMTPPEPSGL